jgi:hypothetical protein
MKCVVQQKEIDLTHGALCETVIYLTVMCKKEKTWKYFVSWLG